MDDACEFWMDTRKFPLVEVRYPRTLTDAALERFLARLTKLLDRPAPFVLLVDSNDVRLSPGQRRTLAESMGRRDTSLALCVMVLPSAATRCIMTALLWLASPAMEMRSFGDVVEARSFCLARLRAGIRAPGRARVA